MARDTYRDATRAYQYRIMAGLTQAELAERCNVGKRTIVNTETGRTAPRPETLARMIDACNAQINAVGGAVLHTLISTGRTLTEAHLVEIVKSSGMADIHAVHAAIDRLEAAGQVSVVRIDDGPAWVSYAGGPPLAMPSLNPAEKAQADVVL